MSNNIVNITGFLSIGQVSGSASSRLRAPVVEGWISTADAMVGGRHPFRAEDRQALVILEYARLASEAAASGPVGISAHARLVSHPRRSYLEIKFISFFDTAFPVIRRRDGFVQSSANLQGHLTIRSASYLKLERAGGMLSGLVASLATGTAAQGGQHPVLISGEELAALRQDPSFQAVFRNAARITLPATLSGTLFTKIDVIYVLANFLSLDTRKAQPAASQPTLQPQSPGAYLS